MAGVIKGVSTMRHRHWMNGLSALAMASVLVAPSVVLAQSAATDPITYQQPPAPIAQILDTKPSAAPSPRPARDPPALFARPNPCLLSPPDAADAPRPG